MDRRRFSQLSIATAIGIGIQTLPSLTPAYAEQAPAVCGVEELPLLEIEMNDDGMVVQPSVQAGLTRVSITNVGTLGDSHLFIARLAETVTDEDFATFIKTHGGFGIDFETDMTFLGAPDWPWPQSDAVSGVVEFIAGRHLILNIAEFGGRQGVGDFVVEGEATAACEPAADFVVTLNEFGIDLPDALPAGASTWKIENVGVVHHEVAVMSVPDGFTVDDLMTLMMLPENGTPPPGTPMLEYSPEAAIGILSPQSRTWLNVHLEQGSYLAVCMLPFGTGYPHAMDGMAKVVTVS